MWMIRPSPGADAPMGRRTGRLPGRRPCPKLEATWWCDVGLGLIITNEVQLAFPLRFGADLVAFVIHAECRKRGADVGFVGRGPSDWRSVVWFENEMMG